uniref:CBS domain-containing protein n=1 Tax=Vannella robusta TaxID=1487602 RepID=A0A7S4IS23_9EUKA|mmetsp:Transcript_7650/g.9483  ORF Transcript_7650/g.9483 Transcript_7650/m.9483 type:complete len:332 (+) Transcript_7650:246-1241(+)
MANNPRHEEVPIVQQTKVREESMPVQEALIKDIGLPGIELVSVKESEPISLALNKLQKSNIRSLAVKDASENFVGFVTVYDIMTYICFSSYSPNSIPHELEACKSLETPIGEIRTIHQESEHSWKFKDTEPLSFLLNPLSLGFHQVLVRDKHGRNSVITQHDMVKYFCSHPFDVAKLTLKELGFGNPEKRSKPKCCSIESNRKALYAFRKMEIEGYSALPVIDPATKKIIATISASDVRLLTLDRLDEILLPVIQFLGSIHSHVQLEHPLVTTTDVSLLSIMFRLIGTHHRHMWVVDSKGRHIDTVSLSDIIAFPAVRSFPNLFNINIVLP